MARSMHTLLLGAGAMVYLGAPALVEAQANRPPDPNAKWMMVSVLRGDAEKDIGLKAADALRSRTRQDLPFREVYVVPKEDMEGTLKASGFPTSEPLLPHDARALAQLLRADEYLTGSVNKTEEGEYVITANLVLTRDNSLIQPLGTGSAKRLDGAARAITSELKEARKQLEFEQKCVNAAREQKWEDAAAAAREGIEAYPNAVLARICLANVMVEQKVGAAELLAVTTEIVERNPRSRQGLSLRAQAFRDLDQQDSAITTLTTLLSTDPSNARLQVDVIDAITKYGNPRIARPIIEDAVKNNPGDPELLRLEWLIMLAVRDFKEAFVVGDELVRLDTAFADTTYFERTAAAYAADSQPQKAAETAARGVAKFPDHPGLNATLVIALRQSGQNQQALEVLNKALAGGVPVEGSGNLKVVLLRDLGDEPGALAAAREAVAKGDSSVAGALVALGGSAYRVANESKDTTDYDHAIEVLAFADSVASGEQKVQAQYYFGVANLFAGQLRLNMGNEGKSCDLARRAKDHFLEAQINLPKGGAVDPAQTQQLLGSLMQLDGFADQVVAAYCR